MMDKALARRTLKSRGRVKREARRFLKRFNELEAGFRQVEFQERMILSQMKAEITFTRVFWLITGSVLIIALIRI